MIKFLNLSSRAKFSPLHIHIAMISTWLASLIPWSLIAIVARTSPKWSQMTTPAPAMWLKCTINRDFKPIFLELLQVRRFPSSGFWCRLFPMHAWWNSPKNAKASSTTSVGLLYFCSNSAAFLAYQISHNSGKASSTSPSSKLLLLLSNSHTKSLLLPTFNSRIDLSLTLHTSCAHPHPKNKWPSSSLFPQHLG